MPPHTFENTSLLIQSLVSLFFRITLYFEFGHTSQINVSKSSQV